MESHVSSLSVSVNGRKKRGFVGKSGDGSEDRRGNEEAKEAAVATVDAANKQHHDDFG